MAIFMICAGLLGILGVALALNVGRMRNVKKVSLGDGGDKELQAAIRAHGNFMEFVPICLILIYLVGGDFQERAGAVMAIILVLARLAHAAGMLGYMRNGRVIGAVSTITLLFVAAIWSIVDGVGFRL